MKALLLFLLLAPLSDVFSQEWTYLTTSKKGSKQYYKKHSENVMFKKIWIKEEGAKLQMVNKNNKVVAYSGHNLSLFNVDCRDRKIALIKLTHYDTKDNLLTSSEHNEFDWSYMSPGSIGDMIITAACDR